MDVWNLGIAQMAIRAVEAPDHAEIEREFTERYQRALATSGREYAEALAKSEALYVLLRLDFEGAAYLRSYLR